MLGGNDFFELFGLPKKFDTDLNALEEAYRRIALQVHPDRFASATPAMRRAAEQWSQKANEALAVLKSPLKRASYLCELSGAAVNAENNTQMPMAFLMQQMRWREALEAAATDREKLLELQQEVLGEQSRTVEAIRKAFDEDNAPQTAAGLVRQLMFIERIAEDLSKKTAA